MSISEPVATLLAAGIGVLGGFIGTFFSLVIPERKKRPQLLAEFLDTIGADVSEMVAMFKRQEIPHAAGHSLHAKIQFFGTSTKRVLGPDAEATLARLTELSQEAEAVDTYLYQGTTGEALRTTWITKAERLDGELRGESAKLRAAG